MTGAKGRSRRPGSLKNTLVISVGSLLVMLTVGNFVLNVVSAKRYLQGQLETQAQDAATALGLSLSTLLEKGDEVTASSMIDAFFDRGYYDHVTLWNANGEAWIVRQAEKTQQTVPGWYRRLIKLDAPLASADVVKGWNRLGSVSVKVNPGASYERMWQAMVAELVWFMSVFVLAILALLAIVSSALRPIASMVRLANGVVNRDFSIRAEESGASELVRVSKSMNLMLDRLQLIFREQMEQIDLLRSEVHLDPVTGLLNRAEFDRQLTAELDSRDAIPNGNLIIVQVRDFAGFNNQFGRNTGDTLLCAVAEQIVSRVKTCDGVFIGRRTGADFVVYLPALADAKAESIAGAVIQNVVSLPAIKEWCSDDIIHAGIASASGHGASVLLSNADMALRKAQNEHTNGWQRYVENAVESVSAGIGQSSEWRQAIRHALQVSGVSLHFQPVFLAPKEPVLYYKSLARLVLRDKEVSAGIFMPMVERFGLLAEFDRHVVSLAVRELDESLHCGVNLGVSISTESALDDGFVAWVEAFLTAHVSAAHCLMVEIPEYVVQRKPTAFAGWFDLARRLGCTLVVDKFGLSSLPFSYLKKYPVRWLKIDRHFLEGLENNRENKFYIQSVIQIAHSLDIKVIECKGGYMSANLFVEFCKDRWDDIQDYFGGGVLPKIIGGVLGLYLLVAVILGVVWSYPPDLFSVVENKQNALQEMSAEDTVGVATTATLVTIADKLLDKNGGYISNDFFPPGIWLDNIKYWEYGVLIQVRDLARAFRQDMSRSQSQSVEDKDLKVAEPQFNFDNKSWLIPATESEYRQGIEALQSYLQRLVNPQKADAQFYARADNLRNWLQNVETRLGSLSQRLSQSVGKRQWDTSLAGDANAKQSTDRAEVEDIKTPWLQIDNVFYEARGTAWALIHIMKAIEIDFRSVLQDKNALVSLRQIITELESTQETVWSPMILNGSGFGTLANHSLTMASYLSRVNAAIIDLRSLLQQG